MPQGKRAGQGRPGRPRQPTQPPAQQLPSGRHGLEPSFVEKNQRERIMTAIAAAVTELGYPSTSVEDIVSRAGVSRRTFYDLFSTKEQAYLDTYEAISTRLFERIASAYLLGTSPEDRLRRSLAAFLGFVSEQPEYAHMCIVDVLSAGPVALDRRDEKLQALAALFERVEVPEGSLPLPSLTAQALVGGVYEVVYKRVLRGETDDLMDLLPDLYYFCMIPFAGRRASHGLYTELTSEA